MGLGDYLAYDVARRVVPILPSRLQRFTPVASWDDAVRATVGYSDLAPQRTAAPQYQGPIRGNDLAVVAAFGVAIAGLRHPTSSVRVVDFGGGSGHHFDLVSAAFPDVRFEWRVVELPEVVDVMATRIQPGLTFQSDLSETLSHRADIAFASASLNYVPDPIQLMQQLASQAELTILARLPLWPVAQHSAAIQRVVDGSTRVGIPTWFFSEDHFFEDIKTHAEVVLDFVCADDRASFGGHYSTYRGLVLARRSSHPDTAP